MPQSQKPTFELNFRCPKKWNSMEPTDNGRFCTSCNKTVQDFSKTPFSQLKGIDTLENSDPLCGNFKAYQLHKPFGNWKDRVVSFYQSASFNWKEYRPLKPLVLILMTVVLIATGCHRNVRGKIKGPKKKHRHTEQCTDDKTDKKREKF